MKNSNKWLGNELDYFKKVLMSQTWSATEGSWAGRLEKEFSKKFESKYSVAFNSGTSTLHSALVSLGVEPGDEVISPAITVIMNTSTMTISFVGIPSVMHTISPPPLISWKALEASKKLRGTRTIHFEEISTRGYQCWPSSHPKPSKTVVCGHGHGPRPRAVAMALGGQVLSFTAAAKTIKLVGIIQQT